MPGHTRKNEFPSSFSSMPQRRHRNFPKIIFNILSIIRVIFSDSDFLTLSFFNVSSLLCRLVFNYFKFILFFSLFVFFFCYADYLKFGELFPCELCPLPLLLLLLERDDPLDALSVEF